MSHPDILASVPEKARGAVLRKPEIAFKIVLNNADAARWNQMSTDIFIEQFPELQILAPEQKSEMGHALKSSLMNVRAGEAGWEERLLEQFQIERIVAQGELGFVPSALWQFFDC